jgi:hypothetical protein
MQFIFKYLRFGIFALSDRQRFAFLPDQDDRYKYIIIFATQIKCHIMKKFLPIVFIALCPLFLFAQDLQETEDGILYEVLKEGKGDHPALGQEVTMHIKYMDANETVLYNTNDLGTYEYMVLGEDKSQSGMNMSRAITTMTSGSKVRFIIPKETMGDDPKVNALPGDHVIAEVELIEFGAKKPSGAQLLVEIITSEGVEKAAMKYQELSKNNPEGYTFREGELNRAGYTLLEAENAAGAIALFRLNCNLYPDSFNTFDSLGDAYLANGDTQNAKVNFEKALQLNPGSTFTKEKLAKLK